MRKTRVLLVLVFFQQAKAQNSFQLAPPLLKYASVFFPHEASVEIKFAQGGTTVHYTCNNREPTEKDPVYTAPVLLKKNFTTLRAKAFGKDFIASETVAVTFIKDGKKIKAIESTAADPKYPGSGPHSLTDNQGGIDQAGSGTWLGYRCDTVTVKVQLEKPQTVKQVLVNFLQSESNWIFLPDGIVIYWFDKKTNNFLPFGKQYLSSEKETKGSHCAYRLVAAKRNIITDKLLINLVVKKTIPEWHPAKGQHAWMFMDEIKIY